MLKYQVRNISEIVNEGYFMTVQQEGKDLTFFMYDRNKYLAKNELKIKVNRALRNNTENITFRLFYHKPKDNDFDLITFVQINKNER